MVTYYRCKGCGADLYVAPNADRPPHCYFCGCIVFEKIAEGETLEGKRTAQGTTIKVDGKIVSKTP